MLGVSCFVRVGSGVQTDATTPNNVETAVHRAKDTTHKAPWKSTQHCWPTTLNCAWELLRPFPRGLRLCKLEFDSHLGAHVASTMLEDVCKRIQHCCTSFSESRDKRNVGCLKS